MDIVSHSLKRKKRRTRKCLDEIRKRSRTNEFLKSCNCATQKIRNPYKNSFDAKLKNLHASNYVTNNRLTLAMFPKAIRSKTITRSILSETTKKRKYITIPATTSKFSPNVDNDTVGDSDEECSENNQNCQNLSNHNSKSSWSLILLSTQQSVNSHDNNNSHNREPLSSPASSTDSSRVGFGYHLYTEFINDIPTYIKMNAPAIIKEDVISKSKAMLQSIVCTEGCHQEDESVKGLIQSCILTQNEPLAPGEVVIQDPKDYIRLGCTWREDVIRNHKQTSPDTGTASSTSTDSPSSPVLPLTCMASIQDTPEYTYYPHRLNQ